MPVTNGLDVRVAEHDAQIQGNREATSSLAATVERLAQGMEAGFRRLTDQISAQQKTPWGTIVSGGGACVALVIAIISLGSQGYIRDLSRQEGIATKLLDARIGDARDAGAEGVEIETLKSRVSNLDTSLQREMRDVNATTDVKIIAADRRLQDEIAANTADRRRRESRDDEELRRIADEQVKSARERTESAERIRALERAMFKEK